MACSCPCAFVKWQIETIRYTRSNDQWWVAQGGEFVLSPDQSQTPPELPLPLALDAIRTHLTKQYGLEPSTGHCDDGCRCVQTGPYKRVLSWIANGDVEVYVPPLGGSPYCSCTLSFATRIAKYRARGECVPANLPGQIDESPGASRE